ncbi:Aste57867_20407 [Aphanomyces stellatus]|uniref:Aste57867_20407 protein n=1 Tax=Aphanomyces stellatus TaxID=120398 RepID=A0A485LEV9_9STRA|nr:hypothetical protein As57867_020341 [Aphanomyces stellatus]VFT97093.1 Aste57867_20407 [Aphanomyces stellatus]
MTQHDVPPRQAVDDARTTLKSRGRMRTLHDELEIIQAEKNDTVEKYTAKKWHEIFQLHHLLTKSDQFRGIPLAGRPDALYESLFKAFPHELVSKARFVGVMRSICGIESTRVTEMNECCKTMVKHLESMHYCFEVLSTKKSIVGSCSVAKSDLQQTHQINWRLLLCALYLLREPKLPESAYLWFGFQLFASPGYLDDSPDLWITRHDLYSIYNFASGSHACSRVINQRIAQADTKLPTSILNRSHIHYEHVCLLSNQTPLQALFAMCTNYTSYFLELTSPLVRHYVFQQRKFDKDRLKCRKFLSYYHNKTLRLMWVRWVDHVTARRDARRAVLRAISQLALSSRMQAFDRLRENALQHVAAVDIQRIVRGVRGRQRVLGILTTIQAATAIQRLYRDRGSFIKYLRQLRLKNRHAIKIQSVYRGRLGRIQARKRLLEHFEAEMTKLQAERAAYEQSICEAAARRIQRVTRAHKRHVVEKKAAEDNRDVRRVELEMEAMLEAADKVRREHRAAVTAYYDKMREETNARAARKIIDDREREKMIAVRRQREWANILVARKAKLEEVATTKATRQAERQSMWAAKVETDAVARKEKRLQVLLRPKDKEEDAMKAALTEKLNAQYKVVQATFKATGVAMAAKEMMDRARHDVLMDEMETERQRVRVEWKALEAKIAKQEQDEADHERLGEIDKDKKSRFDAATRIQRGAKMFLARKHLRKKVEHAFEKVYDVPTGQLVYLNTRSGGVCPKPFCLGDKHDLVMANKWYICPDISGDVYYYNPKTMRQSWSKPDGCVFCESCSTEFAQVYCPHHMKGHFVDPVSLCQACYAREVVQEPALATDASTFDGAQVS